MGKGKVSFWTLIFIVFLPCNVYSESVTLKTYGKNSYITLEDLITVLPELKVQSDHNILLTEVNGNGAKLRFRSSSSFYILDNKVIKIPLKVIYSKGKTFIPPDLAEAIIVNLIPYEIFYQFRDQTLALEVRSKDAGKGFLPIRAVVIDAGHGGKDPGTSDTKGNNEKDISLKVAIGLSKALSKEYPEMVVYLTRDKDVFIPLEERSVLANKLLKDTKEAVFISLHCNASLSNKPSGYEIYYLSQTPTTEQARELAILENKILTSNYVSPISNIQAGMMSSLVQRRSKNLADRIDTEFQKGIGSLIPSRGVKKADFSVLRGSLMPAVLIEMGYLSHPKESIFLNSAKLQNRIIKSIIRGIQSYGDGKE
ncbi:N-acetylmuramoyl-L-alanine amidase family protein [Leptospira sp. GIMC2001]|uniref:N-acetylmuramoyl-L-alanine amidase family protein n=1 Tax=Leptospira sp. GIMC2001 TaxID=1513297 RepID=UPI002349C537|nr:N-acetylmuramoyl-L-alanine amidase [Leptospira sp. GIMC2001]WCL48212.1 N-acetylmuramoyl-L-alanine amidase [Leptospira sp. GIMC2001]